ncbi:MAG: YeeE/YedE thiosulfate transporter family protein, partial [Gammaproteobacteria bacterium]
MEEFNNVHLVAVWGFVIAAVFGFVSNKTNFCSMGAISDVLHMGSKGRLGAWFLAIGIAVLGTQGLQLAGLVDVGESIYLGTTFTWFSHVVGGLLFGVGMTLGAGCGQRNLVRLGTGNLRALVVLLVLGITAYATVRGLLGPVRIGVFEPVSVDLAEHGYTDQRLSSLLGALFGLQDAAWFAIVVAAGVGLLLILYALRQPALRQSFDNLLAGVVIGLCIVAGWFVTGYLGMDDFDPVAVESFT